MSTILGLIDQFIQLVSNLGSGTSLTIAMGVVELILRIVPTSAPLSIAWIVVAILKKLSVAMESTAELMDKVLPQKLNGN